MATGSLNIGRLYGTAELEDLFTPRLDFINQRLNTTINNINSLGGVFGDLGGRLQSAGRFIGTAGDRLTFLTAGLTIAATKAIELGTTFEQNMVKIVNLAGVSEQAMSKFRAEILQLGPDIGKGPNELAEGLYSIASVGMRGAEAMDILERSAKASAVGLGSVNDVSKAVVAAMTAYGSETLTATQATDKLMIAVREGGAEASQFANTFGRIVGTASELKISYDELLASVASFTRVGVRADEAVTALRGTMAFLMKPSKEARDTLLELGTSMDQVRRKVKEDGLAAALVELVQLSHENQDALGRIIPNVRALAGVLANTGEQANAYKEILRQIQTETGTLDEATTRYQKTAAFTWQSIKAEFQKMAIDLNLAEFAQNLLESLRPLISFVGGLIEAFNKLDPSIQTVIVSTGAFVLALGPLMSIGGRIIEVFGMMLGERGIAGLIKYFRDFTTVVEANTVAVNINGFAQEAWATRAARATVSNVVSVVSQPGASNRLITAGSGSTEAALAIRMLRQEAELAEKAFVPFQRQLLLTGETAVQTGINFGRFATIIRGAGLVGLFVAIGTALVDLVRNFETYSAPFERWIELQKSAIQFVGDLISKLLDFIGVTSTIQFIVEDARNAWGGWLGIVESMGSIFSSTLSLMKDATIQAAYIFKDQLGKELDTLITKFAQFSGHTRNEVVAGFGAIALSIINAIPPLRDLAALMGFLGVSLPKAALDIDKAAEALERMAYQSRMATIQRENPGFNFLPSQTFDDLLNAGPQAFTGDFLGKLPWEAGDFRLDPNALPKVTLGGGPGGVSDEVTQKLKRQREALEQLHGALVPLTDAEKILLEYWHQKGATAETIATAYDMNRISAREYFETLEAGVKEIKFVYDEVERVGDRINRISEGFDTEQAKEWAQALADQVKLVDERITKTYDLSVQLQEAEDELTGAQLRGSQARIFQIELERTRRLAAITESGELADALRDTWNAYYDYLRDEEDRIAALERKLIGLTAAAEGLKELGAALGGIAGKVVSGIGGIVDAYKRALELQEQFRQRGFGATGAEKLGSLLGGAGSVIGATAEGTTAERTVSGGMAGAAAGAMIGTTIFPGLGTALGAAIGGISGAVTGLLRGIAGLTEYEKRVRAAAEELKKLRAEAIENFGGLERLGQMARLTGIQLSGVWNTKDPEFFKSVMDDIEERFNTLNDALERYNISWTELGTEAKTFFTADTAQPLIEAFQALTRAGLEGGRVVEAMSDDINDWLTNALRAGTGIPPAMGEIIRVLIETGRITEQNAALMLGFADSAMPSLDSIREAAERYGVTLDQLGPKVAQLEIHEIAEQLVADWKLFEQAGVDVNTVLGFMGEDINELVQRAINAGLALPDTMKPLVQAMIDAGLLMDDTGQKLTDISQIEFTKPLTAAIADLIAKLDELIQKFIDVGKTEVSPVPIPYYYEDRSTGPKPWPGDPPDADLPVNTRPEIPMALGGDFLVTGPTLFKAGDNGWERATFTPWNKVQPEDTTEQIVIVQIGDETVARAAFRGMPRVARVRGI